jgi:hypothetical protein
MGLESCTAPDLCIVQVVDFQDGAVLGTMLVETDIQSTHGKSQSLWLSVC